MVEVFRTNVRSQSDANRILACIHKTFVLFEANFDLEDCDKVLRVKSAGVIKSSCLIDLLERLGFDAEILPDIPQSFKRVVSPIPANFPLNNS